MVTEQGDHTLREILSQPSTWAKTMEAFRLQTPQVESAWQRESIDQLVFIGCGSTYYLSLVAAAVFQKLNAIPSQAKPSSEVFLHPEDIFLSGRKTLLVAVSRSGETTETLHAVEVFREQIGGPVFALTCYPESALIQLADLALIAQEAQEESIAQTRSFTSMSLLAIALAAHLSHRVRLDALQSLPEQGEQLIESHHNLARELGKNRGLERFFFLGSGELYGIACEAMLKMKEMSLSYSEAYHPLEFRHGPMSMVNENTLTIGLLSDAGQKHEISLLEQMRALGGQVMILAREGQNVPIAKGVHQVRLPSESPQWARIPLYLPILQLMAYYQAIARGLDPDHPTHLDAVVRLKSLRG
jgi:glucosamine--fructose-6-phosphate aminotransferase (isomerizing)